MNTKIIFLFSFLLINTISLSQNWKNWNTSNSPIPTNNFTSMAIDANDNVWLSSDRGVAKFDGYNWVFFDNNNSPIPHFVCYAIATEGNTIWIGSVLGLVKFDGVANWEIFTPGNSGLTSSYITSIDIDKNGIKWIGTLKNNGTDGGGITKFDDTTWTNYNTFNSGIPTNWAFNAFTDHANIKWIGTSSGLSVYNDTIWTTYTSFTSGLPNNLVSEVKEDSILNSYWIATDDGLAYFNKSLNSWTIYDTSNFMPDNVIFDIEIDSQNRKWFTTYRGITMYDNTNWYYFDKDNVGEFLRFAGNISFDSHGGLWVESYLGISYFGDTLLLSDKANLFQERNNLNVTLFPIPTNDKLYVSFKNNFEYAIVRIYDLKSSCVLSEKFELIKLGDLKRINTSELKNGFYFVSVITKTGYSTTKIIVSH